MNPDLSGAAWRKSSRSGNSNACVEVATNLPGLVAVRDSKAPDAGSLAFTPADWRAFLDQLPRH